MRTLTALRLLVAPLIVLVLLLFSGALGHRQQLDRLEKIAGAVR